MNLKITLMFSLFLSLNSVFAGQVKYIRVLKSERLLELVDREEKVLKSYKIMLGRNPIGPKIQEGDFKTPEGSYLLNYKNPQSLFHKSLHISYPDKEDIRRAKNLGVKPGGDIMVHGLPNDFKEMRNWLRSVGLEGLGDDIIRTSLPYFDWTSGCIAVLNEEIDEIYEKIQIPTPILIKP